MSTIDAARRELRGLADPAQAQNLARFFKTGPGQYGEGDRFIGVKVPQVRAVLKAHRDLPLRDRAGLLDSPIHEERLLGALMLVDGYQRAAKAGDTDDCKAHFDAYMARLDRINNWDLVDLSAPRVVGAWLMDKDRSLLDRLAASGNMWHRRVAVLATFQFIYARQFGDTLRLCERLLGDPEDLMHKAMGWMLREVDKKGGHAEARAFLKRHGRRMPRTMLRYAIERYPEAERRMWLRSTKDGAAKGGSHARG